MRWVILVALVICCGVSAAAEKNNEFHQSTTLSEEEAKDLVEKSKGRNLHLANLKEITPEVAEALAKFKGDHLALFGLTTITPEVAEALSKFNGDNLNLMGLTSITPEVAKSLAGFKGSWLSLDGLESITPEVAEALSKFKGDHLSLFGLTSITPEVAEAFVQGGKISMFSHLEKITPEVAEALSKFSGDHLDLNGLTSITPEVAEALSKFNGDHLNLDGLTSITPEVAKPLAGFRGSWLSLDGLESITPEVAKALALRESDGSYFMLSLGGLDSVSDDVLSALEANPNLHVIGSAFPEDMNLPGGLLVGMPLSSKISFYFLSLGVAATGLLFSLLPAILVVALFWWAFAKADLKNKSDDSVKISLSHLLFSFRGRIGRGKFWFWHMFAVFLCLASGSLGASLLFACVLLSGKEPDLIAESVGFRSVLSLIVGVTVLMILWSALAVQTKRWHDRNKSGWWILINMIPFGSLFALVENGFLAGDKCRNDYGPPSV